jgi:hypothetical protein
MVKIIDKKLGIAEKVDKFYLNLFEKLNSLVKLQLILCPYSEFHKRESMAYKFKVQKKMYEHLSHGISFNYPSDIESYQLYEGFKNWLENIPSSILKLSVLNGRKDTWLDKSRISLDFDISEEEIRNYKIRKQNIYNRIKELFNKWQTEKTKNFSDWYEEEASSYGPIRIKQYNNYKNLCDSTCILQYSIDEIPSTTINEGVILVSLLMDYLTDNKNDEEKLKIVFSYLQSSTVTKLPFNKINAALLAAIAHNTAHGGHKNPPNIGMANDIEMVSTLLPYCDALFVDSEIFNLLNLGQVKKIISSFSAKIFSPVNKSDFLTYLDEIEKSASKKHIDTAKLLYGEEWLKPFVKMYEV